MKLEDELKQTKPFKSEFQKLVLNIAVTSSWLNSILIERLKPFDLTPPQFNVLKILNGKFPESYCNQEITQRMIDKSSNATRIVDKLKEKGLVDREEDPSDRRLVIIKITPNGQKLLSEVDASPVSERLNINNLDEEKAKLMNEWLEEIRG